MSDLAEVGRKAIEDQDFYEALMEDAGEALASQGFELSAEDREKVTRLTAAAVDEPDEMMAKLAEYHASGAWDGGPWPVW